MKINFPIVFDQWPESLPHDQDRAEVRLLSLGWAAGFSYLLALRPVFYMLTVPDAPLNTVTLLANRQLVILLFLACSIAALPQVYMLLFRPDLLNRRWPRKMLVVAGILSGVLWGYLSVLSLPLDYGLLPLFYAFNAVGGLAVGALFGFSLNCQQLRALIRLRNHEPIANS